MDAGDYAIIHNKWVVRIHQPRTKKGGRYLIDTLEPVGKSHLMWVDANHLEPITKAVADILINLEKEI